MTNYDKMTKAELVESVKELEQQLANPGGAVELPEVIKHETFDAAYHALQADIQPVHKTGINPHFKATYSQLVDIHQGSKLALYRHGMFIEHTTSWSEAGGRMLLTSRLHHIHSDQNTEALWPVFVNNPTNPQEWGKSLTYGRRYNEMVLLNIAPTEEEDDDGEGLRKTTKAPRRNGNGGKATTPATITPTTLKNLNTNGSRYYGAERWEEERPIIVTRVTKDRTSSSRELYESEGAKITEIIAARLADRAQEEARLAKEQAAQPVSAQDENPFAIFDDIEDPSPDPQE